MKKDNNIKTLFLAIVAVLFIGTLVGGGTYAYWIWQTNESQRTPVTFTISKPGFTITGTNVTSNTLMPTQSCYHSNSSYYLQHTMAGRATVVANNNTTASMKAMITLKGKLTLASGKPALATSGSNSAANIHWAIKEVSASNTAFSAANCTGTTSSTFDTGTFAGITANGSYVDIPLGQSPQYTRITFDVAPNTEVTKFYQIYVWIDSAYTHTNYGNTNDDPMQGLTVSLTFSETSLFTQEIS